MKYMTAKTPKVIKPSVVVKGVSKREEEEPTPIAIIVNSKATGGSREVSCIAALELLKFSM